MTETVNIHEAKAKLASLVDEVSLGKEVVIAKAGKPLVKLTALKPTKTVRKPGFLRGKIRIARDFNAPLPNEVVNAFEGKT